MISGHFSDALLRAAINKKHIRFIGDNLNFMLGVKQETTERHKHMVHMFASCALISDHYFLSKPHIPEIELDDLSIEHILPSLAEYQVLRSDCSVLIAKTIATFLPQLSFIAEVMPQNLALPENARLAKKTQVIPMPVLPLNEQYYQDVVHILDSYESTIQKLIQDGGLPEHIKIHIGGDQLTRERFSYGSFLRIGNRNPHDRFAHLGPITFEFYHLGMNFMEKVIFRRLWKDDSQRDMGTMNSEATRIFRHSVDPDVMKAYDADKEFILSFAHAYIIEAAMDFFGMAERNDMPTRNIPPQFANDHEKRLWAYEMMGKIIDSYVFPAWSGNNDDDIVPEVVVEAPNIEVQLGNGKVIRIRNKVMRREIHRQLDPDNVKNYGHLTLELCIIFMYFLEMMKTPDRSRIMGLFKFMLLVMKANNRKAKYPLELLRLLVQQYSLLPLDEAFAVLHACFVNTKGRPDSFVPADQQMEWIVRQNKKHIKHMFSNKNTEYIECKSSSLSGIAEISKNFDSKAAVLVRAKRHNRKDVTGDELTMMDDLRQIRPFHHQAGRSHESFPRVNKSLKDELDGQNFHSWFMSKKLTFTN